MTPSAGTATVREEAALGWSCEGLSFTYPRAEAPAVAELSVLVAPSVCTAVIGPNGSGKSTFLRLLVGTLRPSRGRADLGGRPVGEWSRTELAQAVGVVPQHEEITFPLTVRELVAMGRYPHLGPLRPAGAADHEAVELALEQCDVARFAERDFNTLSGGERQRVRLARALAQEPRALVLDEPTLALDVRHEMEIFELVRELAAAGVTVLMSTHHLNLAARYADALLLLDAGKLVANGTAEEVLRLDRLRAVYRWPLIGTRHPGPGRDAGSVQVTPMARDTDPPVRPPTPSADNNDTRMPNP
jgi:iron complex transport system ATP-binding protein